MRYSTISRLMALLLSLVLLVGTIPAGASADSANTHFLTDAQGSSRVSAGKYASGNHELIDIKITDGKTHMITVYLLDEDNSGRWSIVDVIDPNTQKLLDSQNVHSFSDGVYLSWNISGHVQLRLTNVWTKRYQKSKDTAIYGVFVDGESAEHSSVAKIAVHHDQAATKVESINVLGRIATPNKPYDMAFTKEAQSVEIRFNGNVAPNSENIDKITVRKNGQAVSGEMRTGFHSVTFDPVDTLRAGIYTVKIPGDVKNSKGQEIGKETTFTFEIDPKVEVTFLRNAMNYQTRRVDLSFNDRIISSPKASLVYDQTGLSMNLSETGSNGGRLYIITDKFLPSGQYTFTLPAGVKSVSGAVSTEEYKETVAFDSKQLSASVEIPKTADAAKGFNVAVKECIGYNEVRYAFSEETLKNAEYKPVAKEIAINPISLSGVQTLYLQFRVNCGFQKGTESPVLHKGVMFGTVTKGELLTFDMQTAGAYDKDGFGSDKNPHDGVFDEATEVWGATANYIADGENGFAEKVDPDKDGKVVTPDGIPYQLSSGLYVDGEKNVATANGVTIPAPKQDEYSKVYILAAGKKDDNKGTFVMNYTDGTKSEQEVNIHYWEDNGKAPETIVFNKLKECLGWWNNAISQNGVMRQYVLTPEEGKTLESVTLPKSDVLLRVFAMTGKVADKLADGVQTVSHTEGGVLEDNTEFNDPNYSEFVSMYGNDSELMDAAQVTDVTNVTEVAAGDRVYDENILKEQETVTGGYGQSMYPYVRQPEKLMSYKIRMQVYENYELNFEDALETIRRLDNLTRGIEKKCYLVGWQMNGHDSSFPYLGEVNPRHKRPMDQSSLDSLKWLMKEAKKYNTDITLHVNFSDAYVDDNPLGQQMLENQLALRNENGKTSDTGYWSGHNGFLVSTYANYFTGNWQKNQMDPLLKMLPGLEGQSIHPDAWRTLPEKYYGISIYDAADAQRRCIQYARDKYNMDLTTEFDVGFSDGKIADLDHVLYFPMIWQHGWSSFDPMRVPAYIQTGINETSYSGLLSATGRYFGYGTPVEPTLWNGVYGPINLPGLKESFATGELTRQYLNTLMRHSLDDDTQYGGKAVLYAYDGTQVISSWDGNNSTECKRSIVEDNDVVLQEYIRGTSATNIFMPMVWRSGLEIQAWSEQGYQNHEWKLPKEWKDVFEVDLYDLNFEGVRYLDTKAVSDRTFTMDMAPDQTVIIVPKGHNPNSTESFAAEGTVAFVGRDTKTGGNWTKKYGTEAYELFEGKNTTGMTDPVELNYVNGAVKTVNTGLVPVEKITLDHTDAALKTGETVTLQATVTPDTATNKEVTFTSSDESVAKVDEHGVVTAVGCGNAVITAAAAGKEATCSIQVQHTVEHVDSKAASCTVNGNIEYWYCQNCDRYFDDAGCTQEIAKNHIVVQSTGHEWESQFTVDKEPTATEAGQKSIHCKHCDAVKNVTVLPATAEDNTPTKTPQTGDPMPLFTLAALTVFAAGATWVLARKKFVSK